MSIFTAWQWFRVRYPWRDDKSRRFLAIFKVFVLFCFHNIQYRHSFNHIHTIHLSVAIRRGLSPSPHRFVSSVGKTEPRIELGPALQQADALPTAPRTEPHHTEPFLDTQKTTFRVWKTLNLGPEMFLQWPAFSRQIGRKILSGNTTLEECGG